MPRRKTQPKFTLTGYDKDSDAYEDIKSGDDDSELCRLGKEMLDAGARRKSNREPFDWFEVVLNATGERVHLIA